MSTAIEGEPVLIAAAQPVVFRIKGEFRRSSLYTVVGIAVAGLLAIAIGRDRGEVTAAQWIVLCSLLASPLLLWLYVQTYRLRIDSTGMARRRLGVWSYWTWREFSDGRVQGTESPLSFSCPARPWWDRWLMLEWVEPEESAKRLAKLLRAMLPHPAEESTAAEAIPVPGEIQIGIGFRTQLRLTVAWLECRHARQLRQIAWEDVNTLRLIRQKVNRTIVSRLELRLRGGEAICGAVSSVRIEGQRIWQIGDHRADWPRRVERLVPPRCWEEFRTLGELHSSAEGEFRLDYYRKKLTATRRLRRVLPPLLLAGCSAVFIPKLIAAWNVQFFPAWWKAVLFGCTVLIMLQPAVTVWAFLHFAEKQWGRRLIETEEELAQIEEHAA